MKQILHKLRTDVLDRTEEGGRDYSSEMIKDEDVGPICRDVHVYMKPSHIRVTFLTFLIFNLLQFLQIKTSAMRTNT